MKKLKIPFRYAGIKKTLLIMKIMFCLLVGCVLQATASVYSQNTYLSLDMKNAKVTDVLNHIKEQSEYKFLYRSDIFDNLETVDLEFKDKSLEYILDNLVVPKGFTYVIEDNVVVIRKISDTDKADGTQKPAIIKGTVTDSNGEPMPGVSVFVFGTSNGTVTTTDGTYEIKLTANAEKLVFSFIGMETQEIEITNKEVVDITMKEDFNIVDEVVVVGYGQVEKKDFTGSVASVKSKEIGQFKTQTIDAALAGQMAGVQVMSSGGAPGSGSIVHVRGLTGLTGDNQPLYVVDGVPIIQNPNFNTLGLGIYGERSNPLLSINPEDIERVDVLKDASSAAIYGSRAANGVILITTKKGSRNQKPRFSFTVNSTVQNVTNTFDYLNAEDWIGYTKDAAQATLDRYPEAYWSILAPVQSAIVSDDDYFGDADTDWQKEIINKNALWNDYNFNVNGGTDKVNYFISVTASNQKGTLKGGKLDRYSLSSSLDANVVSWFKVGTSINYNYSINKSSGLSSLKNANYRPDLAVYDENGDYTGSEYSYGYILNPLGDEARVKNRTLSQNMYGRVYGELELFKALKVRSGINLNLNDSKVSEFSPSYSKEAVYYDAYYSEEGARLDKYYNSGYTISFENTLNFHKKFNEIHKLDAMAGVSWDQSRLDLEETLYYGFPDDDNLVNIQSASYVSSWQSESIESGLNSYFGRFNYTYDERYLLTFTARYDGSTKFGPDNRWGFFPSGAFAWNMHNEQFLKNNPVINQLKLRASYGRTGQDNLPAFSYLAYYESLDNGDSYYNGVNGIAIEGVPNYGIKWETTNQLDLGVEFGLFNNRLNGEVVYFSKKTSDIILLTPIAAETGSSTWSSNIADVSNKGWEFNIDGDIIRKENFRWNSAFNISFVKNNVDAMHDGTTSSSGSTGIKEGYPIGVIVGYKVEKIAQTQDEINALDEKAGGTYQSSLTEPGDYIFKDVSGSDGTPDGVITTADKTVLGDINPDFYGGWKNTMTYKNFDLGINFLFVEGGEREFKPITNLYTFDVTINALDIVNDTWTEDNTDAPYAKLMSSTHGSTPTSRSVVDASYIRLRSASLGYTFPKKWTNNTPITNARISFSGNNLFTITKYPGLDPESVSSQLGGSTVGMISDDGSSYPNTKTYTLSLNVTF